MPSLNHVHTYKLFKKRTKGTKILDKVFRCSAPDCTHFTTYEQVLGKKSRCNICGAEFLLDREALKRVEPRCLLCSQTRKGKVAQNAQVMMTNIFSPPGSVLDIRGVNVFDTEDVE